MTAAQAGQIRWSELWRFYQAAVINTAFGFGLYALLIWLGLDRYVAQAIAFVSGVAFNYLVYSRHVFRDGARAKARFAMAYGLNYLVNLGLLKLLSLFVANAYIAGFSASLAASLINYLVLKHLVFVREES